MNNERPLILFPKVEIGEKAKRRGGPINFFRPTFERQKERVIPKITALERNINERKLKLSQNTTDVDPEMALVFEIIGSIDNFYSAISKIDGMEWLAEYSNNEIDPDEDFYLKEKNEEDDENKKLTGKVYCVMTNKSALDEFLNIWKEYIKDKDNYKFKRGYTSLRDVFQNLKDVRVWSAKDRIEDTGILKAWKESIAYGDNQNIKFQIELFFRKNNLKRLEAQEKLKEILNEAGGQILKQCVIEEIHYHCVLVELPAQEIEKIIENYNDIKLVLNDDIMYFKPTGQNIYISNKEEDINENFCMSEDNIIEEPILALLDGFPLQNHTLLKERLIIDDADDWESSCISNGRVHGTSMSSLIIHGDLSRKRYVHNRKIYVRPIMKTYQGYNNEFFEKVPEDVILVDYIHSAVVRMLEGDKAVAKSIKIINLCVCDSMVQFINVMSPLARLIDYLSYKYNVLFIISSGNHAGDLDLNIKYDDFIALDECDKQKVVLEAIEKDSRNRRLLSPSESINSITVGAIYKDENTNELPEQFTYIFDKDNISPYTSIGNGYNRSIKPDLFYNGGRCVYKKNITTGNIELQNNYFKAGCKSASPNNDGGNNGILYACGTSDATALVSHEALELYEILNKIFSTQQGNDIPKEFAAILLKAMIIHGCEWGKVGENIARAYEIPQKRLAKWIGNGIPNFDKVKECEKNRITLIGYGNISKGASNIYTVPIPIEFSNKRMFRKLTVTLAYFSPINAANQKYRGGQMWFDLNKNELVTNRVNTDNNIVRRGTIQHEIFYGQQAVAWDENDNIEIKVNCDEDATKEFETLPYAIMVSFEIAEDIDVYEPILEKIKLSVKNDNINIRI